MNRVWDIYCKEIADTLRDRRTLIFMFLLPTLLIPGMMLGISRLAQEFQEKEQIRPVTVAASDTDRIAYRRLVHDWFAQSRIARGTQMLEKPFFRALLKPDAAGAAASIPKGVATDPEAFESWVHDIVGQVRENIDSPTEQTALSVEELPDDLRQEIVTFYQVAIKGFALIEFVDPEALAQPPDNVSLPESSEHLADVEGLDRLSYAMARNEAHGLLRVEGDLGRLVGDGDDWENVRIVFYHDSTIGMSAEANRRIADVERAANEALLARRLEARGLPAGFVHPVSKQWGTDLATPSRQALSILGMILPYLIIIFTFLGGFYPAVDLAAGEKERQTLETLLLAPVGRTEIALGKYLTILTTSLTAALLGVASLAVSFRFFVPAGLRELFDFQVTAAEVLPVALLMVPPAMSFAGILLAVSIYARSFKEAQNYIAPLQFILIVPALASVLPGIEMNAGLALVPLVNVSLLARDFLKGSGDWWYFTLAFVSTLVLAGACLAFCVHQFKRESVLFRS